MSCENNQIIELKLNNCHKLTGLYCCHNKLTNLDLSKNKKISSLVLDDNNFPEQDLSFLSHLMNLKRLQLANIMSWTDKEENGENIYNRFSGSLKPLQNMTELYSLEICNTDIDSGLEYLPLSLKEFYLLANERKNAKSNLIANELRKFGELVGESENCIHLLEEWRKANFKSVKNVLLEKLKELQKEKENFDLNDEEEQELKNAASLVEIKQVEVNYQQRVIQNKNQEVEKLERKNKLIGTIIAGEALAIIGLMVMLIVSKNKKKSFI